MSNVTSILTGRMNLKRNTSYLLEDSAISSNLLPTRQPSQGVLLEVEVLGCTVSSGIVTVYSGSIPVSGILLQDRTLVTKWFLQITNGGVTYTASSGTVSNEPIVEDSLVPGVYWKIYMDNGIINWEQVVTVQNDYVILLDTSDSTGYLLQVSDGDLGISEASEYSEVFNFSENTSAYGEVDFTSIAGISTSGISDGFIRVRGLNHMGQPVNQLIDVQDSVPVRFFTQRGRIKMKPQGQELVSNYKIMVEPDLDIRENDLIYPLSDVVGLTMGMIGFVETIWDFAGVTHHVECELIDV